MAGGIHFVVLMDAQVNIFKRINLVETHTWSYKFTSGQVAVYY